MMIDSLKNEYTFSINDYSEIDIKTDKKAIMQNILNIIFGDEYMLPSVPRQTGLFIQKYRFAFIDDAIASIQMKLMELINLNIPGNLVKDIHVHQSDKYTLNVVIEFLRDRIDDLKRQKDQDEIDIEIAILQIKETGKGYDIKLNVE